MLNGRRQKRINDKASSRHKGPSRWRNHKGLRSRISHKEMLFRPNLIVVGTCLDSLFIEKPRWGRLEIFCRWVTTHLDNALRIALLEGVLHHPLECKQVKPRSILRTCMTVETSVRATRAWLPAEEHLPRWKRTSWGEHTWRNDLGLYRISRTTRARHTGDGFKHHCQVQGWGEMWDTLKSFGEMAHTT